MTSIEPPHLCRLCFHCKPEWEYICVNWEAVYYSQNRKPGELGCKCWFPKRKKEKK